MVEARTVRTSFVAIVFALALGGCSSTSIADDAESGPRASGTGAPAFAAETPTADAFRPLDLPTGGMVRTASGDRGPGYWQQRADYAIEAVLDPDEKTLAGKATLRYVNASPEPLAHLWLHVEQNLFAPESLGAKAFPGDARYGNTEGSLGGMALESIKIAGKAAPFRIYDTLAKVDLPAVLAPMGGVVELEIRWTVRLPEDGSDRMGFDDAAGGTIFLVAQWFPSVVKFDDVRGWNTLPYLGPGEFYTDFGDYDVAITVPRSHLVAATGVLQNPDETLTKTQIERLSAAAKSRSTSYIVTPEEAGTKAARPDGGPSCTWRFKAADCRTFAFASSASFLWDAAATDGVLCQSFYPREALPAWSRSTDHLCFSLEHYGAKWRPYPYPVATNVNGRVGGMEYPMIVFCSERKDEEELWLVTTHEIGHTWFPMMVNTDERRHAWMDEGFNTFMNWYATLARFPDRGDAQPFKGLLPGWFDGPKFLAHLTSADRVASDTPPDRMASRLVGLTQYGKPAVGLVLLREEILGPERFDAAFRRYIERWKFASPQPADFFRSMEDAAGVDLAWFWRGWFLETGFLDQAIESGGMVREPDGAEEFGVVVTHRGALVMPAVVRFLFADGAVTTKTIPIEAFAAGRSPSVRVRYPADRRLTQVVIDPDGRFPDVDRSNNVLEIRR